MDGSLYQHIPSIVGTGNTSTGDLVLSSGEYPFIPQMCAKLPSVRQAQHWERGGGGTGRSLNGP